MSEFIECENSVNIDILMEIKAEFKKIITFFVPIITLRLKILISSKISDVFKLSILLIQLGEHRLITPTIQLP
jgi:hypothetical protein